MEFSVLMSVHAGENPIYLNDSLCSIWENQTCKPTQIVLVKDGPLGKELASIVSAWKERISNSFTVIELNKNVGLGAALNVGLKACKCELVARMDSDDLADPDRFRKQLSYFSDHPEADIVGSFVREMSYSGDLLGIRTAPITHEDILSCLWASPMVHPSIMMRRSRVLATGSYDPRYRRRQDYELWFRCAERGLRFYNLAEPLLFYRFGRDTHRKQPPKLAWEQAIIGYQGAKRLGMPLSRRFACFLPFIRSLLPTALQHTVYKVLSPFDPRRQP